MRSRRGQSLSEYALTLTVGVAAMLSTQTLLRRAVQSHVKELTDEVLVESERVMVVGLTADDAQREGVDLQDPGSGFSGGDVILRRKVTVTRNDIEHRTGAGAVMHAGLEQQALQRVNSESRLVGQGELPADFVLRPNAFEQLTGDVGDVPFRPELLPGPPTAPPGVPETPNPDEEVGDGPAQPSG